MFIHSWFPCSLANCSALRKSAVMAIVIKVCNTIRNFLYPIWWPSEASASAISFDTAPLTVRRSQIACCVPVWVKRAIHHTTKPDRFHGFFRDVKQGSHCAWIQHSGLWSWDQVQGYVQMETVQPHHYQDCSSLQTPLSVTVCHCLSPTVCPFGFVSHRNYLFYFPFLPSAPSPGLWCSLLSSSFFSWSWKLCGPFDEENGYLATASITCFPISLSLLYTAGVNAILRTLQSFSHRH